jgi:hypothetical protein
VDALDLCYTKSHVNTFVIISGDSDFSPLVSKLRENAKQVIGVGVKQSTSDLLIANCDEFIFYDDLVRESQRAAAQRDTREAQPVPKRSPDEEKHRKEELEVRKSHAIEMAVETFDALVSERGDSGKIWASTLKQAIKRRKPDFNESYYGFRAFGNLLEEAQARGFLELGRDEKSGAYIQRSSGRSAGTEAAVEQPAVEQPVAPVSLEISAASATAEETSGKHETRRRRRESHKLPEKQVEAASLQGANVNVVAEAQPATTDAATATTPAQTTLGETATKTARKPAARSRRPRKPAVMPDSA